MIETQENKYNNTVEHILKANKPELADRIRDLILKNVETSDEFMALQSVSGESSLSAQSFLASMRSSLKVRHVPLSTGDAGQVFVAFTKRILCDALQNGLAESVITKCRRRTDKDAELSFLGDILDCRENTSIMILIDYRTLEMRSTAEWDSHKQTPKYLRRILKESVDEITLEIKYLIQEKAEQNDS